MHFVVKTVHFKFADENELGSGHFLILGTRAEDFSQGYETFLHYFVGVRKFLEQFLWGTKLFFLKKFWMKPPMKD